MGQFYFLIGALCGLLSVIAGAFGAHALNGHIDSTLLAAFQTGAQYQMYHALALMLVGMLLRINPTDRWLRWSGRCFAGGIVFFSGSLYAMALTGIHGFGWVTPAGGLLFILGWIALTLAGSIGVNDKPLSDTTRPIRSFVRRQGRLTLAQGRAFERFWPRWGLASQNGVLDLPTTFPGAVRHVFEVGFGMGHTLAELAQREPATAFVGAEVHRPGVGKLLSLIEERGLQNIRIYAEDASDVLERCIADNALDAVLIFFPDPWHKTRHHKRRLIQPPFVQRVHARLKPGGLLHLATDWQNYAEHMMAVLGDAEGYSNLTGAGQYAPRPESRPETKFERRGLKLGHGVWDLVFQKSPKS